MIAQLERVTVTEADNLNRQTHSFVRGLAQPLGKRALGPTTFLSSETTGGTGSSTDLGVAAVPIPESCTDGRSLISAAPVTLADPSDASRSDVHEDIHLVMAMADSKAEARIAACRQTIQTPTPATPELAADMSTA